MGRRQSLSQERDRRFESGFLQQRVTCEPSVPLGFRDRDITAIAPAQVGILADGTTTWGDGSRLKAAKAGLILALLSLPKLAARSLRPITVGVPRRQQRTPAICVASS
jgi:hypothetical protein